MIVTAFNINGCITPKLGSIKTLLNMSDLVCITETWLAGRFVEDEWLFCDSTDTYSLPNRLRLGGGVAVFYKEYGAFKRLDSICNNFYQILAGSLNSVNLVPVYIKPQASAEVMKNLFFDITRLARGNVTLEDFNARNSRWDTLNTPQGTRLYNWIMKTKFKVLVPLSPTFVPHRGSSVVDMFLVRRLAQSMPQTLGGSWPSDHLPVIPSFPLTTSAMLVNRLSQALLSNHRIQKHAARSYSKHLPSAITQLKEAESPDSLEAATMKLSTDILRPWLGNLSPKPPRYRPGWTRERDVLANERYRILKKPKSVDVRAQVKAIDRTIKQNLRRNRRRLLDQQRDELEKGAPNDLMPKLKRLELVEDTSAPEKLAADDFTRYLQSTQPEEALEVRVGKFDVSPSFKDFIVRAITCGKKKKAPGPDFIPLEVLRLETNLIASALLELWRAVGRVSYAPRILRSGFVAPIFKKRDPTLPSNYRTITLLLVLRKVISKALHYRIGELYHFHRNQWGFIQRSNTELAAAFAAHSLRHGFSNAGFFDLKSAYDSVLREKLLDICTARLPDDTSRMLPARLMPVRIKTLRQVSGVVAVMVLGVLQGDPLNPTLFNIFMDTFLEFLNRIPRSATSCFAEDVLLLAIDQAALASQLRCGASWASIMEMNWNASKSYIVRSAVNEDFFIGEEYLGVQYIFGHRGFSFPTSGPAAHRLLERLNAARVALYRIRRVTVDAPLSVLSKVRIVKLKILPLFEYCLPLQPISAENLEASLKLELEVHSWILGAKVGINHTDRSRPLTKVPSLEVRRAVHSAALAARFRFRHLVSIKERGQSARCAEIVALAIRPWLTVRNIPAV